MPAVQYDLSAELIIRTTPEQLAAIDQLAREQLSGRSAVVRAALAAYIRQHTSA